MEKPQGQALRCRTGGTHVHHSGRRGGRPVVPRGGVREKDRAGTGLGDRVCGCGPSARLVQHRDLGHRERHHHQARLFRRYRQSEPAPHQGPDLPRRRGLRRDGIHLRRPAPRPPPGLCRGADQNFAAHLRPGRQCGHSQLRGGPHAGAALLHPGDQGKGSCEGPRQLPGVHRQSPCHRGDPHLQGYRPGLL